MSTPSPFDLRMRARQALLENGFVPDMPAGTNEQLQHLPDASALASHETGVRDLRDLLWSSIDNDDSRDLDQIEVVLPAEEDRVRLLVGIADVAAYVTKGSPIDQHANANTATIYTGVATFPMLPETLSTGQTSLLDAEDRLAIVTDMTLNAAGEIVDKAIYPALVRNRARLTYERIGPWLERDTDVLSSGQPKELHGNAPTTAAIPAISPIPPIPPIPGLDQQLLLQHRVARAIYARRLAEGALEFETVEAFPTVENGKVVSLTVPPKNEARKIIENFMILANTTMATFLAEQGQPSIQRVVREPARWDRIRELAQSKGVILPDAPDARALSAFLAQRKAADPDHFPDLSLAVVKLLGPGEYAVVTSVDDPQGHFGLAAYRYTHSTAPNRRYADLIIQRLLKALLAGETPPYSREELTKIAAHCSERENAARKVERLMRKVIAANLLRDQIGHTFHAIVTGASPKGIYVRLLAPPVEGRVVRHEVGLDVGDKTNVRLIAVDAERGFIDFERIP